MVYTSLVTPAYSGITTALVSSQIMIVHSILDDIISDTELTVNVGTSSITHHYNHSGEVYEHFSLNHGSGYREPVSIAVTDLAYVHRFERAVADALTGKKIVDINVSGVDPNNQYYTLSGTDRTGAVSEMILQSKLQLIDTLTSISLMVVDIHLK